MLDVVSVILGVVSVLQNIGGGGKVELTMIGVKKRWYLLVMH